MKAERKSPFEIVNRILSPPPVEADEEKASGPAEATERVKALVASAEVFLFVKGTPTHPQCGFSAQTLAIMHRLGCEFSTFDVLSNEDIRQAAKEVAEWPTFPQVWVRGEFIGGNDIVTDMYQTGELQQLLLDGRQ